MPLDNQSELFYWVDENDRVLGSITRNEAHSGTNKIHRASVVFIFSPDNQDLLLQQRSSQKDMSPGFWAESVGGHVSCGQTYKQAAIRETQEELGLLNLKLKYHSKYLFNLDGEREYHSIYTAHISPNTPIHFDRDEIQQISWIKLEELSNFINTHPCTSGFLQCWQKIQVGFAV